MLPKLENGEIKRSPFAGYLEIRFDFFKANKLQIKDAIQKMYGVTIEAVNTLVVSGKVKSRGTKAGVVSGRTPKYKKAIVTLKEGEVIDFYSNI
mgnify:CR=1 FL=1